MALALFFLLGTAWPASHRGQFSEDAAISLVKRTTASQLDKDLPQRSFGGWLSDTFKDWAFNWEMNDCGEQTGDPKTDAKRDLPSCVQVDIMQPPQDAGGKATRGFHVIFQVGTEKKGLLAVPKFRSATHQEDNDVETLTSLSEVEP